MAANAKVARQKPPENPTELELPDDEGLVSYSTPIGQLLSALNALCKKPQLDNNLSEILDQLIGKLEEADKYIENGIYFTNFPEAALLLQTSSILYAKKVDLLWEYILQYLERNLSYDNDDEAKNANLQKLEERTNRFKRKRKKVEKEIDYDLPPKKKVPEKQLYDIAIDTDTELVLEWRRFQIPPKIFKDPPIHPEIYEYEPHFEIDISKSCDPDICFYDDDGDLIGKYRNIYTYNLIDVLIGYHRERLIPDTDSILSLYELEFDIVYRYLSEKKIPADTPRAKYEADLRLFAEEHIAKQQEEIADQRQRVGVQAPCWFYIRDSEAADEKLRRTSMLETVKTDHSEKPGSSSDIKNNNENSSLEHNDSKVSSSEEDRKLSQDSGYSDTILDNDMMDVEGNDESMETEANDTENVVDEVVNSAAVQKEITAVQTETVMEPIACFSGTVMETQLKNIREAKKQLVKIKEDMENGVSPTKIRRMSRKTILKLIAGLTCVKMMRWESFHSMNYQAQKEEGKVDTIEWIDTDFRPSIHSSEIDDGEIVNPNEILDIENSLEADPVNPIPDIENTMEADPIPEDDAPIDVEPLNDSVDDEDAGPPAYALSDIPPPASEYSALSEWFEVQQEKIIKNVKEWKTKITPILKSLQNSEFDIHQYGTDIMNGLELNEAKPFSQMVQKKSSSEVVRYFISSLQLANTYNVELTGGVPGELCNDTLQLKLLTKERYHEHLEEYNAPSKETLRQNLAKMRALKRNHPVSEAGTSGASTSKATASTSRASTSNQVTSIPSTSNGLSHSPPKKVKMYVRNVQIKK